jgi:undecaprenyl-diphosphatase
VDWRIYHAINGFVADHPWIGSLFRAIETYGTVLIGVAAVLLWLAARPGGDRKWKIAAGCALASAAVALIANRLIASAWHRDRPFQAHDVARIWGPRKSDPSFPSDHSSAAFAIAVAVSLIDPFVGAAFVALAVLIAVGRVVVGEHYPGDVLGGAVVGSVAALVVVRVGKPLVVAIARVVERATDPLVRPFWRRRVTDL